MKGSGLPFLQIKSQKSSLLLLLNWKTFEWRLRETSHKVTKITFDLSRSLGDHTRGENWPFSLEKEEETRLKTHPVF